MMDEEWLQEDGAGGAARTLTVTSTAGGPALSLDLLQLYFENKKRSGGGAVSSVSVAPHHEARVTFENEDDMRAVLRQPEHTLCGVRLEVRPCDPLDATKVLLLGLSPTTHVEVLQLYVEALSGEDAADFTLHRGAGGTAVLVHFRKAPPPDLKLFVRKCGERCLAGAHLRAERVHSSPRLWVGNLAPSASHDLLALYFESRQSGGGSVHDVALSPSGGHAVVTFCSTKVVDQVLGQTHRLGDRHLDVKPYFPQLEEAPSDDATDGTAPSPAASPGPAPAGNDAAMETQAGSASDARNGSAGAREDGAALEEITETVVLKADHVYLLPLLQQAIGSADNVFDGLNVAVSQNEIQITGTQRSDVMEAKCRVLTLLSEAIETPWAVDGKTLAFLRKSDVAKYLRDVCQERGIHASYRVTDSSVLIGSLREESGDRLKEAIAGSVDSFRLPLPPDQAAVTSTPEWSEFVKELEATAPVHFECAADHVEATVAREHAACVQAKVATFVRSHAVVESVFPVEEAVLDYLQDHSSSILQQISEQMTLIPVVEPPVVGFKMYGTEVCCSNVREILQSLVLSSLLVGTVSVPRPGVTRLLCHHVGRELLSKTEQQFLCKIRPKGTSWDDLRLLDTRCTPARAAAGAGRSEEEEVSPRFVRTEGRDAGRRSAGTLSAGTSLAPDGADGEAAAITTSPASSTESLATSKEAERAPVRPHGIGGEARGEEADDRPAALREEDDLAAAGAGVRDDQEREFELAKQLSLKYFESNVTLNEEEQLQMAIENSLAQERQQARNEEDLLEEALQLSTQNLDKDNEDVYQLALCLSASETATPAAREFERAIEMSMQTDSAPVSVRSRVPDSVELVVCADASGSLERIGDYLLALIDGHYHEIKLENECFKRLSPAASGAVEREYGVRLVVAGSSLVLYGCKVFTAEALGVLNQQLETAVQEQFDAAERDLIGRSVRWLWGAAPGVAVPYPPDATVYLERMWQRKKGSVKVYFNGHPHTVDLNNLEELREGSDRPVKVFRRDLGRAAEDDSLASAECVALVDLEADSAEFKTIEDQFVGSLETVNVEILQIQKVHNSVLYRQFLLKKQQIERECSQPPCERILYHGTAGAACSQINLQGFDRSFCGKNAALYGQGVYFATSARISVRDQYSPPDSSGRKRVYVARVLSGDFAQGHDGMRTPPARPAPAHGAAAGGRFHSVVDNTLRPDIFVIFNDTQAYPEHLITFRWVGTP